MTLCVGLAMTVAVPSSSITTSIVMPVDLIDFHDEPE
jgi:hypothetical protein